MSTELSPHEIWTLHYLVQITSAVAQLIIEAPGNGNYGPPDQFRLTGRLLCTKDTHILGCGATLPDAIEAFTASADSIAPGWWRAVAP